MRRVTLATVAAFGAAAALAGCSGDRPSPAPAAAAVESVAAARAATVPNPVRPEMTTEPPHAAAGPHRTATAPPAGAGSGDAALDRFVAAVQRQLPEVAVDRRDEEIEALGRQACDVLAAGGKTATAARDLAGSGVTTAQAGKLVTLARSTACRT